VIGRTESGSVASAAGIASFNAVAPRLPADDEQAQRTRAIREALLRRIERDDVVTQWIAHPLDTVRAVAAQRAREPEEHAVGAVRENSIREAYDCVGVVDDERLAGRHAHQGARE
jgi:hypothetical protein